MLAISIPGWTTSRRNIYITVAAAVAGAILAYCGLVWQSYQHVIEDTSKTSENLARVIKEQVQGAIRAAEFSLSGVADLYATLPETAPDRRRLIHEFTEARVSRSPFLKHIFIMDGTGLRTYTSLDPHAQPTSFADRSYFTAHESKTSPRLFIGAPISSRINGEKLIPASIAMKRADDTLAGVVVAALDPEYFQRLYGNVDVGANGSIAMFLGDGTLLTRQPHDDAAVGRSFSSFEVFSRLLPVSPAGTFREASKTDGLSRIFSYRTVPNFPLVIVVGVGLDDVLTSWRARMAVNTAVVAVLALLVTGLIVTLARELKRRDALAAAFQASERKAVQAERMLADAIENIPDGFAIFDHADRLVLSNKAFSGSFFKAGIGTPGIDFADFVRSAEDLLDPNFLALHGGAEGWRAWRLARHKAPQGPFESHYRSGHWYWLNESKTSDDGTVIVVADITDIKRREQELLLRSEQQKAVAKLSQLALEGPDLRILFETAVEAVRSALGVEMCTLIESRLPRGTLQVSAGVGWREGVVGSPLTDGDASQAGYTLRANGPVIVNDYQSDTRFTARPLLLEHGVVSGISVVVHGREEPWGVLTAHSIHPHRFSPADITFFQAVAYVLATAIAQQRHDRAIRKQQAEVQAILENTMEGLVAVDLGGSVRLVNPAAEQMFGYAAAELVGRGFERLIAEPHRSTLLHGLATYLDTGDDAWVGQRQQVTGIRGNGDVFPMELGLGLVVKHDGVSFIASVRDLTERKQAEEMMRQAQKMDVVGQLTGGVAHDFNNLLTVILGNAETLADELYDFEDLGPLALMIEAAAERGADLTRRLLAFSRRQPLQPSLVDPNRLVQRATELLSTTLEENIEIEIVPAVGAGSIEVDPSQMQSALLNLAINARDAMPDGGKLKIQIENIQAGAQADARVPDLAAGDYVRISVTDSGAGMPPDVLKRVFEPFFTTKPVGKGTGLGLSMVYGFVKQSSGHIDIDSEVDRGTTISLYFPRQAASAASQPCVRRQSEMTIGGSETILVVEDDSLVRQHVVRQLRSIGYAVIEAGDARTALDAIQKAGPVRLLFTDIVMPGGMDGLGLAQEVRARFPSTSILLTSGYTERLDILEETRAEGVGLLLKPYRLMDLADKIRSMLDEEQLEAA